MKGMVIRGVEGSECGDGRGDGLGKGRIRCEIQECRESHTFPGYREKDTGGSRDTHGPDR